MNYILTGRYKGLFKPLPVAALLILSITYGGILLGKFETEAALGGVIMGIFALLLGALLTLGHPKNDESIPRLLFYGLQNGIAWLLLTCLSLGCYNYHLNKLAYIPLVFFFGFVTMVACFVYTVYSDWHDWNTHQQYRQL
jgi:hypothetical protein